MEQWQAWHACGLATSTSADLRARDTRDLRPATLSEIKYVNNAPAHRFREQKWKLRKEIFQRGKYRLE
jgi:hypothetical protein